MKISQRKLKRIIKEEIQKALNELGDPGGLTKLDQLRGMRCNPKSDRVIKCRPTRKRPGCSCQEAALSFGLPAEPDEGRHGQEWLCHPKGHCDKLGGD